MGNANSNGIGPLEIRGGLKSNEVQVYVLGEGQMLSVTGKGGLGVRSWRGFGGKC